MSFYKVATLMLLAVIIGIAIGQVVARVWGVP